MIPLSLSCVIDMFMQFSKEETDLNWMEALTPMQTACPYLILKGLTCDEKWKEEECYSFDGLHCGTSTFEVDWDWNE